MGLRSYGSDISCVDDVDASLTIISGETCFGQSLARRISTPNRGLFYDFDYGIDARRYLHRIQRAEVTSQAVEQECLKDERVEEIRASVEYISAVDADSEDTPDSLTIELRVDGEAGPFDLTVDIDDLSVTLINESL